MRNRKLAEGLLKNFHVIANFVPLQLSLQIPKIGRQLSLDVASSLKRTAALHAPSPMWREREFWCLLVGVATASERQGRSWPVLCRSLLERFF